MTLQNIFLKRLLKQEENVPKMIETYFNSYCPERRLLAGLIRGLHNNTQSQLEEYSEKPKEVKEPKEVD